MNRDAFNAGIQASYVFMDTWFINEFFIKDVIVEGIDVIGMFKDNKQRYHYHDKMYNLKQLAMFVDFNRMYSIFKAVCVKIGKQNNPEMLVFVRNRNKKNDYIIILSSDCCPSASEIVCAYENRWSIGCFSCFRIPFGSWRRVSVPQL